MPVVVEAVGTVQAIASIQIKPRIDSQIMKVHVEEGALVKEGDLLFELDSRTLQAQLGQIEAQIRKDQAQLVQARRDLARYEDLLSARAPAPWCSATPRTTSVKAAEAQLEADEAAKASVTTLAHLHRDPRAGVGPHRLDLEQGGHGRPRRRQHAASTLATINQVDPIFVSFAIPQVLLPDLRAAMAKGPVKVDRDRRRHQQAVGCDGLHREHRRSATPAR